MFPFFLTFISFEVSFFLSSSLFFFFFLLSELHLEFYLSFSIIVLMMFWIHSTMSLFSGVHQFNVYTSDFWLFINKIKVHGFYCRFNLSVGWNVSVYHHLLCYGRYFFHPVTFSMDSYQINWKIIFGSIWSFFIEVNVLIEYIYPHSSDCIGDFWVVQSTNIMSNTW